MNSDVLARVKGLMTAPEMRLPAGAIANFDPGAPVSVRQKRVKVLFVISAGRSGSTLLDRLIGQYEHVAAIGELYAIWEAGLGRNIDCGCGRPFLECPLWTGVLKRAFGEVDGIDPQVMEQFWRRNDRMFGDHFLRLRTRAGRESLRGASDGSAILDALCAAVADESGADLVVDTSKSVFHAWFAMGSPTIEPYVLHLLRDPRAVVHSWTRPMDRKNLGIAMPRKTMTNTTAWWVAINAAVATIGRDHPERYMQLRYEDLSARPGDAMEAIGRLCGVPLDGEWLRQGGALELKPTHAGYGNKMRYETKLEIRSDERWRTQMPAWRRRVVGLAVWPWSRRYGYGG